MKGRPSCRALGGLLIAFPSLLAVGCEGNSTPLAPVHGRVLRGGKPVPGATLVFTPDSSRGTAGPMARAETAPDGTFVLRTANAYGAAPGWYRVTVMVLEDGGAAAGPPRSLLPDRYRDPELSGLSCQVRAGVENRIEFNVDD